MTAKEHLKILTSGTLAEKRQLIQKKRAENKWVIIWLPDNERDDKIKTTSSPYVKIFDHATVKEIR